MRSDARGGQLEGEGDAIQPAADLGHDRCIGIRQFERMTAMGDLLDEQLHRRKVQGSCCCHRPCIRRRALQGRQMMHLLALGPQCLPARDQDVNLGGVAEYVLGQRRDGLDEMLAAIEHQQRSLLAQMRQDNRQRLVRNRHKTQLGRQQTRDQSGILDGPEIEEVNGALKVGKQSVRQCQGDGRLAYSTCPDDRYKAVLFQQGGELTNRWVASHHDQGLPRQLRGSRGGRRGFFRRRLSLCLRPGHPSGKAVAAAGNIGDVVDRGVRIAEPLAKGGNVKAQTDLIDDQLPPDTPDEVTLADDFRGMLEQRDQDVERTTADLEGSAVLLEPPLGRMQAKRTKRGDFPPQY